MVIRVDPGVTLDAALLALSGRVRLREGGSRTAEEVVTELWSRWFAPDEADQGSGDGDASDGGARDPGKA